MIYDEDYSSAVFVPQSRSIGPFSAYIATEESAQETLELTENPVQSGSALIDHAYRKPTELSMEVTFPADDSVILQDLYSQFIDLQRSITPIDVVTGKRQYHNMLIQSISCKTDAKTEHVLSLSLVFKEVIYAQSKEVLVVSDKSKNGPTVQNGRKTLQKAGKEQSALYKLFGG